MVLDNLLQKEQCDSTLVGVQNSYQEPDSFLAFHFYFISFFLINNQSLSTKLLKKRERGISERKTRPHLCFLHSEAYYASRANSVQEPENTSSITIFYGKR